MASLSVASLSVRGFRNLESVDVELGPRFNVVSGENGQGKTNLLESVYVLATSRSFRSAKPADLVRRGGDIASIRAQVWEGSESREQTIGIRPGLRAARIDGRRPSTLAEYAVRTPTVVFHPGAVALSSGSGAERRKLLDRTALYLVPSSHSDAEAYGKAARARQRVLETRGELASDLDAYETLMATHGSILCDARTTAAAELLPAAERAFARIGPADLQLSAKYIRSAPSSTEEFRSALVRDRRRDRARRSASVGPHRDEVSLTLGRLPVRGIASQGQHRAVVLALELAEIDVISAFRGVRPILLLDDVSSELDRARTSSLLGALSAEEGQVILTTTRPELMSVGTPGGSTADERRDFHVVAGQMRSIGTRKNSAST